MTSRDDGSGSAAGTRALETLTSPYGPVEYLRIGARGFPPPWTVFAHGLGGSIPTTRPFASGVPGSKAFLHFPGHGGTPVPAATVTYDVLAADVLAVADEVGATRALGVSMGAGALCTILARHPDRFERLVLVLPALFDRPRPDADDRFRRLADAVDARDTATAREILAAEQPALVRDRPDVRAWVEAQVTDLMVGRPVRFLRDLAAAVPLPPGGRDALAAVTAPVLVLGQEADETHPAAVAEEIAHAFPNGRCVIFPEGGLLWSHRARVRAELSVFLG